MEKQNLLSLLAVLLLCVFSIGQEIPNEPRSCSEAQICCNGQNNTCFVKGPRLDRKRNETLCYCDSNCLLMGDCCIDFHETCKAVDCQVGHWAHWGPCDNLCGLGSRKRHRKVSQFPENGGQNCPVLKQRQACVGTGDDPECQQQNVEIQAKELQETGKILPAKYGIFRDSKEYNPWKGILKNLYGRNFNEIFSRATYCAEYLITSTKGKCSVSDTWANTLKEGTRVCVECQPTAMDRSVGLRCRGHGVWNELTEWSAEGIHHCRGDWVMQTKHKSCTCGDPDSETNFIFI